jgi:hypothetical protein
VCPNNYSKMSQTPEAVRQRRSRARRMYEASGDAYLFTNCRQCDAPIKPSFSRGFCPGGACRKRFFRDDVRVARVVPITRVMARTSESVLEALRA